MWTWKKNDADELQIRYNNHYIRKNTGEKVWWSMQCRINNIYDGNNNKLNPTIATTTPPPTKKKKPRQPDKGRKCTKIESSKHKKQQVTTIRWWTQRRTLQNQKLQHQEAEEIKLCLSWSKASCAHQIPLHVKIGSWRKRNYLILDQILNYTDIPQQMQKSWRRSFHFLNKDNISLQKACQSQYRSSNWPKPISIHQKATNF